MIDDVEIPVSNGRVKVVERNYGEGVINDAKLKNERRPFLRCSIIDNDDHDENVEDVSVDDDVDHGRGFITV